MSSSKLASWYDTLKPRDQRILQIGGVVVALIVVVGLFLPLKRDIDKAKEELETQLTDKQWMKEVGPTLAALGGPKTAPAPTNESLVVLIDRSAREAGLAKAITSSQPTGKGATRVQLESADFNGLVSWVSRLSSQSVRVENATITSGSSPGVVSASVQLHPR